MGLDLGQRRDAFAHRGREHDRLERRAWLALGLGGEVELALMEVPASEHRSHGAGLRLDRDESRSRPVGVAEHLLDRGSGTLLEREIDGGRHPEPTAEDTPRAVLLHQLILDVVHEVLGRAAGAGKADILGKRQRGLDRVTVLGECDLLLLEHEAQDVTPSFLRSVRARDRVVAGGIGGNSREQCGLVQLEEPRTLAEVRSRSLLDSVCPVSEVDRVQVRREDAVLAPPLLELPRERRLPDLARECSLVSDVRVLDELLRDRGTAFDDRLLADIGPERAGHPAHVDALVVEEALILDGDDRLAHDRCDVLGRHEHPVLVTSQNSEHPFSVRGVDDRVHVGALGGRIERRDLARDRSYEAERERQERERRPERRATPQDDACELGAVDAASPSLSELARREV